MSDLEISPDLTPYVKKVGDTMTGALQLADQADALKSGDYPLYFQTNNDFSGAGAVGFQFLAANAPDSADDRLVTFGDPYGTWLGIDWYGTLHSTPYPDPSSIGIQIDQGGGGMGLKINAVSSGFGTDTKGIEVICSTDNILQDPIGVKSSITGTGTPSGSSINAAFYGIYDRGSTSVGSSVYYGTAGAAPIFYGAVSGNGEAFEANHSVAGYTGNSIYSYVEDPAAGSNFLLGASGSKGDRVFLDTAGNVGFYGALIHGYGHIGQRENMVLHSEDLNNAVWVKTSCTITPNDVAGPFVDTLADNVTTTGISNYTLQQTLTGTTASKTFTMSFWYRSDGGANWNCRIDSGNETGTQQNLAATGTGNWRFYTFSQTFTSGSTGAPIPTIYRLATSDTAYFWGINVSETDEVVAYTPTSDYAQPNASGMYSRGEHLIGTPDGITQLIVRAGGGQGSENLFEVQKLDETPQLQIDSDYNLSFFGKLAFGANGVVGGDAGSTIIHVSDTVPATIGNTAGMDFNVSINGGTINAIPIGIKATGEYSGSTTLEVEKVFGIKALGKYSHTATPFYATSSIYGLYGEAEQACTIAANSIVGVAAKVTTTSTGLITDAYSFRVEPPAFSTAPTNSIGYGFDASVDLGGNLTNVYGMYMPLLNNRVNTPNVTIGLKIDDQWNLGTGDQHAIWLNGDSRGADIAFGASLDANMYWDNYVYTDTLVLDLDYQGAGDNPMAIDNCSQLTLDGDFKVADGHNILFDTTTGTKIGTATTQKLGLWNATPIVQPTTAITAATFVANTSGIVDDTATFDGYTIGQIVKALRNIGALQ